MFFILFKGATYSMLVVCTLQKIPSEDLLPHPHGELLEPSPTPHPSIAALSKTSAHAHAVTCSSAVYV